MSEHNDHGHDDHGGSGKYIAVFIALVILTTISFVVGSADSIPQNLRNAVMIAVSCAKALLPAAS